MASYGIRFTPGDKAARKLVKRHGGISALYPAFGGSLLGFRTGDGMVGVVNWGMIRKVTFGDGPTRTAPVWEL